MNALSDKLLRELICPKCSSDLEVSGKRELSCALKHNYDIYDGIPILLRDDVPVTHDAISMSLEMGRSGPTRQQPTPDGKAVDAVVQTVVAATSGYLYRPLIGRLKEYPIPTIRLPEAPGRKLLDIGCGWGRWSISAASKGYSVTAVDPDLGLVLAARRVSDQMQKSVNFVVADARFLPFRNDTFELVWSYSVLQHFFRHDLEIALYEVHRVLIEDGTSMIQMPNKWGVRSAYHRIRKHLKRQKDVLFDVHYASVAQWLRLFEQHVGPSNAEVDGFLGLGVQESDIDFLRWHHRQVVRVSALLRTLSESIPILLQVADSVFIQSRKDCARSIRN